MANEDNKVKNFLLNRRIRLAKINGTTPYRLRDKNFRLIYNYKDEAKSRLGSPGNITFNGNVLSLPLKKPYITPHDFIYDPVYSNGKSEKQDTKDIVYNSNSTYSKTMSLIRGLDNPTNKPDNYYTRDGMIYLDANYVSKFVDYVFEENLNNGAFINAGLYNLYNELNDLWAVQTKSPTITTVPAGTKNENYNEVYHVRNLFDISEYIDLTKIIFPQKRNLYNYFLTDKKTVSTSSIEYKSELKQSFGSNLLDYDFSTDPWMAAIGTKLTVETFDSLSIIKVSSTINIPYIYLKSTLDFTPPTLYVVIRGVPFQMRCNKMSNHVAIYSWPEYLINIKNVVDSIDYIHIVGGNSSFSYYTGNYSVYKTDVDLDDTTHIFNNISHKNVV